jgi:hypothetical protein
MPVDRAHRGHRQHGQGGRAEYRARGSGQRLDERGAERGVKAGQRPDGEEHRRRGQHRSAHRARQPDLGHERGRRDRNPRDGLPQQPDPDRLGGEDPDQREVDQVRGRGQELDEQRREQRAAAGAEAGGQGVGERAALPVDVKHARPDGAERGPGGDPLDDAGGHQLADPARSGEHQHRQDLDAEGGQQHGPPPDGVGKTPQGQQRSEDRDRVDAEHDRRRDRGESPLPLVNRIQRGRRGRPGEQRHDQRRQQVQRRPPGNPGPGNHPIE